MHLPAGDTQLVQIMDAALADATQRAGAWLACRPGCTQCCHGAFAINALDAARLHTGMLALSATDPARAKAIKERAQSFLHEYAAEFPGDRFTGLLDLSEDAQEKFEDFANDAPCPALDPQTGLCDLYASRPMTCRVFGPPVRMEGESLGCCELCFCGAEEEEIARCEMHPPHALEAELLEEIADTSMTIVAFAVLLQT